MIATLHYAKFVEHAAQPLTLSPPTARRFSVRHRSHRHGSLTGLPGPLTISGRVFVAVQHQPAGRTDMRADAQAFLHPFSACRMVLRRLTLPG
jgi:hypothetical protein